MPIENFASQRMAKRYGALGTTIDLSVYGEKDETLLDTAFSLIQHYENLLTVNRPTSEVMDINYAAGDHPAQVSAATYSLAKEAILESQRHFGFNAAVGPLVKLWHIGFPDARVPSGEEINQRLVLTNPDAIQMNDADFSIFLPRRGMELDFGGIGKGYIADRIVDLWKAFGVRAGIINLGGNVVLLGDAPHHENGKWLVSTRNPFKHTDDTVFQLAVGECSVVTSGIGERHLDVGGKQYHHIISPETGYPENNEVASVTVLTKYSIDAEIETTRLFFNGRPIPNWLDERRLGAIFIYRDKSIEVVGLTEEDVFITDPEYHFRESADNNNLKVHYKKMKGNRK